jgi:hypothetical protein
MIPHLIHGRDERGREPHRHGPLAWFGRRAMQTAHTLNIQRPIINAVWQLATETTTEEAT